MKGARSCSPTITVGVPTRNRSSFLREAINSVLTQTYADFELIVSDNASTDNTTELVRSFTDSRIKYFRQAQDIGMVSNFNFCLNQARGEYFLMLSDDDLLNPNALKKLSAPLIADGDANPQHVGMSWSPCLIIDARGDVMWTTASGPPAQRSVAMLWDLFNGLNGPRFCSVMLRTTDARLAGGYRAQDEELCDFGNWSRVITRYDDVACISEAMASYRVHAKSLTRGSDIRHWTKIIRTIDADLIDSLREQGKLTEARLLAKATHNHTSNIVIEILLQHVGQPGWITYTAKQVLRSYQYVFTLFVLRRAFRDGWKLFSIRRPT